MRLPLLLLSGLLFLYWVWGCFYHGIGGHQYQWWHANGEWFLWAALLSAALTFLKG